MAIEINEMKLTAYALGELYGAERAAVEAHVAGDDEARQFVADVRETARVVTNELAHEPVVGLLAVHHAAIERQLEAVDHLRPLRAYRTAPQPAGARLRHWAALGLTAAASVVIVGGVIAVLAPQLFDPNVNTKSQTQRPDRGPLVIPTPSSPNGASPLVNGVGGAPDPFQRPDEIAVDDAANDASAAEALAGTVAGRPRAGDGAANPVSPFGPPQDAPPRVKRPGGADTALAQGGAESFAEAAPVRAARSDDNRGVENYAQILENPFVPVADSPLSTFDVDVDSASYATARRALWAGRMPRAADVRVEEFVNYFSYDYEAPKGDAAFGANIEVADCPWNPRHRLVRVGLRGRDLPALEKRPAGNLVFLVDCSASMAAGSKLPLVKQALRALVDQMTPADRVAVVAYGGAAGGGTVALPPTSGRDKQKVLDAVEALTAAGSPARGDAGIDLAYKAAQQAFARGGVNRVVLCTDGNFAHDVADQLRLLELIDARAKSNVQLGVIGVGAARINDPAMRTLARRGSGSYAWADTPAEATRAALALAAPAAGAIAKDVKVQVEFNPLVAAAYRLIGYENGSLSADDERPAGGQIAAGHAVTALYEVVPAGNPVPGAEVFALKYSKPRPGLLLPTTGSDEMLTLKLHYLPVVDEKTAKAEDRQGKLLEFAVKDKGNKLPKASREFKFAAAVAEFALILRGSEHRGNASLDRVVQLSSEATGPDRTGARREFVELVRKTRQVRGG